MKSFKKMGDTQTDGQTDGWMDDEWVDRWRWSRRIRRAGKWMGGGWAGG